MTVYAQSILKTIFGCALFASLVLLTPSITGAQESDEGVSALPDIARPYAVDSLSGGGVAGDFVVGPGKVDVTLKPGQSKIVDITVANRTGERKRFKITIEDTKGSMDPTTSFVLLGDERGPYSIKDYLSVSEPVFELNHNERARIPVTISLPADAEPGGFYGSVLVETLASEAILGDTGGTAPQSAIIARIGTLFFVTVPGEITKNGSLREFATSPKEIFYQSGPIRFGVIFGNDGTTHLAPYGELRITNMLGDEVGAITLEPWFVFPQSLRLREVSWDRELLFGRYTATVQVNRSYNDEVDTLSYSFWVLPWKPLVGIFVVFFAIVFVFRYFFRNFEFRKKS